MFNIKITKPGHDFDGEILPCSEYQGDTKMARVELEGNFLWLKPEEYTIIHDEQVDFPAGNDRPTEPLPEPEDEPIRDIKPNYYLGKDGNDVDYSIENFSMGFRLGNAFKYLVRAGRKPGEKRLKDLIKARTYINKEIESVIKEGVNG